MKKIIIKNLQGVQTHGAEMADPTEWINQCIALNVWGKPERWQQEYIAGVSPSLVFPYDPADVIGSEDRPDPITGELVHWVKLRADYTIEITDITHESDLDLCIKQRLKEYPSPEAFMNAFFDGDQAANIEAMKQARLEIKSKYPKPVKA